jgi:membrane fusion protein, macrolide-specific efflux system
LLDFSLSLTGALTERESFGRESPVALPGGKVTVFLENTVSSPQSFPSGFFLAAPEWSEPLKRLPLPQILSLTFLIAALALASCSKSNKPASNASNKPTPTPLPTAAALAKPTYKVQRGEVVGTVNMSGRIAPVSQKALFFTIDGHIHKVFIQEGDTIKAGTLIADLEGVADLQRQLELNKFNLQRNQINAQIAQLNLDLFVAKTPTSLTGYDKLLAIQKLQLDLANVDVQQASLGIQDLQDSISKYQLVAPLDGTLTSLPLSAGSQVHAYSSVGTVADVSQLEVISSVAQNVLLDRLQVGMFAALVPASGGGKPVSGKIRRLPITGSDVQTLDQDNTIRISLDIPPADAGYALGDLVNATVTLIKRENVLWIPPDTVRTFGGRKFVVVQVGSAQSRVDVTLGVVGEDRAEVIQGLTEGQVVVSP